MKPNPDWKRWADWLGREPRKGTIYYDVVFNMRAARQIWEGFQAIVGVAPDRAKEFPTFHSWFNDSYARSQGLAIRRQVEVADDVVSLGRLLDRIAKAPNVLTRERYLELHAHNKRLGDKFFDDLTSPGAKAIDPEMPRRDLKRLRDETAKVREWVTKEVAHWDPKTGTFGEGLTYADVHEGIDLIFEVMTPYRQLILGDTIDVGVTMPPWYAAFTVPWIPNDEALETVTRVMQEHDDRRRRKA
jgi:hypothetical protein